MTEQLKTFINTLKYNNDGLIPVVAQDVKDNQILMLAYMNKESLRQTMQTGYACYYSRSRKELWVKGETSGHRQRVVTIRVDCDLDTLLVLVEQTGPACHEGYKTCFFREVRHDIEQQIELVVTEEKP